MDFQLQVKQQVKKLLKKTRRLLDLKDLLRAIARVLVCAVRYSVVPHSGLPVWGGALGGKGPHLTFDPLRLLSDG